MWNVNERFEKKAIDSLAALGFGVGSTRGVVRVEKYGSGAEFRQEPGGRFRMTVLLWDAGYQKFLLTDEGSKVPLVLRAPPLLGSSDVEVRNPQAAFRLL
jgi:hypothetical protein